MSQKDHNQSAATAGEHARGALGEGAAAVAELVNAATQFLSPKVKDAGQMITPLVTEARGRVSPHLATTVHKVGPYYEKTRDKVTESYENVVPRIQEILDSAADSDYAAKAGKWADSASSNAQTAFDKAGKAFHGTLDSANRNAQQVAGTAAENAHDGVHKAAEGAKKVTKKTSRKARAKADKAAKKAAKIASTAAAVEAVRIQKKKHRGRNRLLTAVGIVAVVGALVVAARQLLMPRDDGWTPREPSNDFDDDVTTESSADRGEDHTAPATDQTGSEGSASTTTAGSTVPATEPDVESSAAETLDEAENVWTGEGGPAGADRPTDFGPDSYVGENPPEGFTIKGNLRSMKYHTPDGAGFGRTKADVWFSSEEAAEATGFTKASR